MATELKRMQQLIGTVADWTSNDIVLGDGEFGLEIGDDGIVRGKVGDGTTVFSLLSYTIGDGVDQTTDQTIGGVKTFTDSILIENQTDDTKSGQLLADNFPALVHAVALDSKELSSNVYIQARDGAGAAQTLAVGSDGKLYWRSKVIAADNGVYGQTWGSFDATGTVTRGTGFGVVKVGTGQYTVNFDDPATSVLDHVFTATAGTLGNLGYTVTGAIDDEDTITIWTTDAVNNVPLDMPVSFIRHYNTPDTFAATYGGDV